MSAQPRRVSVIMRSKNSESTIAQALSALFSQDFADFDLLVVDSGSTDRTCEIVSKYPCTLVRIEARAYFPGAVLNSAIAQTHGEIIVFVNSDAVPLVPQTLSRLVAAFDDAKVQAAFARQLPRPDADTWVRRDYASSFPDADHTPPWIKLSLPMAAMRRSIWEQRPFYTDAWASEDTEWGHWALTHGHAIKYVPDALVMHSHNYTLRQLYGRRFVEGEADAFIFGVADGVARMVVRAKLAMARDILRCLRDLDLVGLPSIVPRRVVYFWAYHQGHKLGKQRIASGDRNAATGQTVVLTRQDD